MSVICRFWLAGWLAFLIGRLIFLTGWLAVLTGWLTFFVFSTGCLVFLMGWCSWLTVVIEMIVYSLLVDASKIQYFFHFHFHTSGFSHNNQAQILGPPSVLTILAWSWVHQVEAETCSLFHPHVPSVHHGGIHCHHMNAILQRPCHHHGFHSL